MCKERLFLLVAGSLISLGVLLSMLFSPWWVLLSAYVGLAMMQASFTGFCPLTRILTALNVRNCTERTPLK